MNWLDIHVDGIGRIDRIAAEFEVWPGENLPFAKLRVKIIERNGGDFAGFTNVAVRNLETGEPEGIAGLGSSVEEALKDTLHHLLREIEQNTPGRPFVEGDFAWCAHEDF